MSTLENISITQSPQSIRDASKRQEVRPEALFDTKGIPPFADVLEALTVTPFENTTKDQPVATHVLSQQVVSPEEKPKTMATVVTAKEAVRPVHKEAEEPIRLSHLSNDERPTIQLKGAEFTPPSEQEFSFSEESASKKEPVLVEHSSSLDSPLPVSGPVDAHTSVLPLQAVLVATTPATITPHAHKDQKAAEDNAPIIVVNSHVAPDDQRHLVMQAKEKPVLSQDLINLIRGDGRTDQPIATVEVKYPEHNPPPIQLPLSVMHHPHAQSSAQTFALGVPGPMLQSLSHTGAGEGGESFSNPQNERGMLQGAASTKSNATRSHEPSKAVMEEKAVVQEMVDRIRSMLKEQQRHDMRVTVQHAEYGQITMNLRFSQQNKHVDAVFMSDNEELLTILQSSNSEINSVFKDAGVTCQQQHVRRV